MSNYPPGVTGNEYQIAGPDAEFDDVRECSSEGFSTLTITGYGEKEIGEAIDLLVAFQQEFSKAPRTEQFPHPDPPYSVVKEMDVPKDKITSALYHLRMARGDITFTDIDGECPFSGHVTIQRYQGMESWECPLCRTVHETEVER